jgi:hypothetical protein
MVITELGPERLLVFLQALRSQSGSLAVQLVNEELDKGANLEELLSHAKHGYQLDVRVLASRLFLIRFGCSPGPMVGDGGEWRVEFDDKGAVIACDCLSEWVS